MYKFRIKDEPFAVGYINAESDSIYVSTGAGYIEAASSIGISFDPDTGFPMFSFWNMACPSSFSSGQTPNIGLLLQKAEDDPDHCEDYKYIAERMRHLDINAHIWAAFSENEWDITNSGAGWGGTWGGHAVPSLSEFARLGTDGFREKIRCYREKNPEKADFYEGLMLTLDALDILGGRIYEAAQAEYERTKNEKLTRVIDTFKNCPKSPSETFSQAVCVYVTVFLLDGIDSPGHFDQYMIDFWRASDLSQSREALSDLWEFFHKTRTWNLCISGSDHTGADLTNELSFEILKLARKRGYQTPNLTMRCHENTPEELWQAAADTIASGVGMPVLYNDKAVCTALERLGIPKEDAHLYVMNGCNQIDIQGKSHMGLEDGEANLGLAVSHTLFGGYNVMKDKQIGKETPPAEELDTFEKFLDAFKIQAVHIMDSVCSMANKAQRIWAKYSSNPLRSMTIDGCLERGLDYKNSGPLYLNGQILFEGVADAIDSIANIKKFVYEDKKYTLSQVREAVRADFEGYEEMLQTFKNSDLSFGNDVEYTNSLASEIIDFCNGYLQTVKTARGGIYSGGCSPFDRAAFNGMSAGALPNGKRKGESLYADSIGATPGKDIKGPTALLNSCLAFDHTLAGSGFILNLKFERSLFDTDEGKTAFIALAKAYFENCGQQLSVSVVSREELLLAQKDPDAHRNLIVRVGGFSEYFVNLPPALQENVIKRTMY